MITSAHNPHVKRVRALHTRRGRSKYKQAVLEGVRLLKAALAAQAAFDFVLYTPTAAQQEEIAALLRQLEGRGITCWELAEPLLPKVTAMETPPGILAVVNQQTVGLEDLLLSAEPLLAVAEDLRDPGNLGTLVRTAHAAGAEAVILLGQPVDVYNPKVLRAAAGATFRVPIVTSVAVDKFCAWAGQQRVRILAATSRAEVDCFHLSLRGPVAIVVGNEAYGLSAEMLAAADERVRIPMVPTAEALNSAVAAAILLYEAVRQRRQQTKID